MAEYLSEREIRQRRREMLIEEEKKVKLEEKQLLEQEVELIRKQLNTESGSLEKGNGMDLEKEREKRLEKEVFSSTMKEDLGKSRGMSLSSVNREIEKLDQMIGNIDAGRNLMTDDNVI